MYLNIAKEKIDEIESLTGKLSATDLQEVMYIYELKERLTVCKSVIAHLATRHETRWHSFAENWDYPEKDNIHWRKYVNSRLVNGEIKTFTRELTAEGQKNYESITVLQNHFCRFIIKKKSPSNTTIKGYCMYSTHYMDLLMQNSPWNLIIFMAIPVILAETIAITDLFLLRAPNAHPTLSKINRIAGILAGLSFVGIIAYFIPNVVIPLASTGEFRTWIDVVAIGSYILAGIPMILLALLNLKLLLRKAGEDKRSNCAILLLAAFLVLSHIAMIFGMVDPGIAGYSPKAATTIEMHHHHHHH